MLSNLASRKDLSVSQRSSVLRQKFMDRVSAPVINRRAFDKTFVFF